MRGWIRTAVVAAWAMVTSVAVAEEGRAVVCLDNEFDLGTAREVRLPAGSVFENDGPITGDLTGDWRVVEPRKLGRGAIVTMEGITLSRQKRCTEAGVRMNVTRVGDPLVAKADDREHWVFKDVPDYKRGFRPPVELGRLVDEMAVAAQVRADVTGVVRVTEKEIDDEARTAKCTASGRAMAAHVGGGVIRQTSSVVILGHADASEISLGCNPHITNLFVSWDRRARPSAGTATLVARSSAFFTGASESDIRTLLERCVAKALVPSNSELGDAELDGVRMSCQAFARDGGAGSVTINRRFGVHPVLLAPTSKAERDVERASERLQRVERQKAAGSKAFTEWWFNEAVPSNVKSTLMIVTRMQALANRCPSRILFMAKIAEMLASAGIRASDLERGGRYWETYTMLAVGMKNDVDGESAQSACEAARRYLP